MGLTAYRFSVEWARVEPVEGRFSEEALDHYEAIVDTCLDQGLAPVVTFSHFTSPHWFAMRGAWLELARGDDFVGVQNYERVCYDGAGAVPLPDDVPRGYRESRPADDLVDGVVTAAAPQPQATSS
jgi:hypothetical protein